MPRHRALKEMARLLKVLVVMWRGAKHAVERTSEIARWLAGAASRRPLGCGEAWRQNEVAGIEL